MIFGATGGTGKHLVRFAQEAGHKVTVLARTPEKCGTLKDVQIIQGDARDPASLEKAIVGQDAVLSALGGDSLKKGDLLAVSSKNIIQAMESRGVSRIVVLGAAGALHDAQKHQTFGRKIFFWVFSNTFLKHPLRDSAEQEKNLEASTLDFTVVHPPRLLDVPGTGEFRELPDGLPPAGYSIAREDVARFMVKILDDPNYFRQGPYIAY